jgi:acetyltransferase-like isoleucine patch superfamily enzyme
MTEFTCIENDVKLGTNVILSKFINLYGCTIGNNCKIGAFVEVQKGATIGNNCKISSHTFICEGVTISNNCFIGHGVMFINDNYPRAVNQNGVLSTEPDWRDRFVYTNIGYNVSIGSNSTILGDVTIGDNSIIGAGSVVTQDVPSHQMWAGNPARMTKKIDR